MKKSLLALTTLLLVSTHSMADSTEVMDKAHMRNTANYTLISRTSTLISEPTSSREAAYQQGYKIMDNLHGKSSMELITILNISKFDVDVQSAMIVDKEVTVKEYSKQPNTIQYKALVNVKYHYREFDSNR
ncbi:DUF3316 domain-containing protein [Vibrio sp. 1-Bac 57]